MVPEDTARWDCLTFKMNKREDSKMARDPYLVIEWSDRKVMLLVG